MEADYLISYKYSRTATEKFLTDSFQVLSNYKWNTLFAQRNGPAALFANLTLSAPVVTDPDYQSHTHLFPSRPSDSHRCLGIRISMTQF